MSDYLKPSVTFDDVDTRHLPGSDQASFVDKKFYIETQVQAYGVVKPLFNKPQTDPDSIITFSLHNKPQEEPVFNALFLDWAKRQPTSTLGYLDVAAGTGRDAKTLADNGFTCIAQDASVEMTSESLHSDARLGVAEKLDFPDNSFSGILNKSTLLFMSEKQRQAFFKEAQRTLVVGGSILLQSQRADIHRAHYFPKGSGIDQCLPSFDFKKYGDRCYEEWLLGIIKLEQEGHSVFLIEYSCLPEDIIDLASEAGFVKTNLIQYGLHDPLALESRWTRDPGFIIELQKI